MPRKYASLQPETILESVEQKLPQPQENIEWLTAKEAAEHLRIKTRTLLQWTRQGKIKGYALSGGERHVWRYLRAELDAAVLGRPTVSSPPQRSSL